MTCSRRPCTFSSRVIGRSSQSGSPATGWFTLGTIGQMALTVSGHKCQHYSGSGQTRRSAGSPSKLGAVTPPPLAQRIALGLMHATQVTTPFHRPGWVYEERVDGYRMVAYKEGRTVRLISRLGKEFTQRFPELAKAVAGIGASLSSSMPSCRCLISSSSRSSPHGEGSRARPQEPISMWDSPRRDSPRADVVPNLPRMSAVRAGIALALLSGLGVF